MTASIDFCHRDSGVQWNGNYTQPGARINELEVIGLVREKKGQPISGSKAMPG